MCIDELEDWRKAQEHICPDCGVVISNDHVCEPPAASGTEEAGR